METAKDSSRGRLSAAMRKDSGGTGQIFLFFVLAVVVKTDLGSRFGLGEFTTHFRTYFSGWIGMFAGGYDLAFDPGPHPLEPQVPSWMELVERTISTRTTCWDCFWIHSNRK